MSADLTAIVGTFCILVLPYGLWRVVGLKALVPCVVVQILLGIALGPSVLGAVAPTLHHALLSGAVGDEIHGIATLAVLFFALLTGLHVDLSRFRGHYRCLATVGVGSVVVPFALGCAVSWWIWHSLPSAAAGSVGGEWAFVLASATALSVTALPVLGAILREMDLTDRTLGQWSLGLAAVNDAALWLLLGALLAAFGRAGAHPASPAALAIGAASYLAFMYGVVRPCIARLAAAIRAPSDDGSLVAVTAFALASAAVTQWIGLHYLLGAFVAGTVLPRATRQTVIDRIEPALVYLLTPFFFISAGLQVDITASSTDVVTVFWVTTIAGSVGKILGTAIPARAFGRSWQESLALGSLLQAKGMMELVVLSILLDAGLLSSTMFSALTLMAVATTSMAMPLARFASLVSPQGSPLRESPASGLS